MKTVVYYKPGIPDEVCLFFSGSPWDFMAYYCSNLKPVRCSKEEAVFAFIVDTQSNTFPHGREQLVKNELTGEWERRK